MMTSQILKFVDFSKIPIMKEIEACFKVPTFRNFNDKN